MSTIVSRSRRVRLSTMQQRLALGALGIFTVLALWELAVRAGVVDPLLSSSPTAVARTLWTEIRTPYLWEDIWVSFQEWILGFGAAAVVGVVLGLVAGWFRVIRYIAEPWLTVLYATPHLALVPIFVVWFGLGIGFKVWVGFLGAVFVITLNAMAGAHATEARLLAVADVYGASRLKTFVTIVLPGSVPYIMTGLRQGSGLALVGVIFAEFLSSNQGVGFYISLAGQSLNTDQVMVGILLLSAFGVVQGEAFRYLENRFQRWRDADE
jgi:ABC-type nitrate/sulfonate/bicarbonate transport system permease component